MNKEQKTTILRIIISALFTITIICLPIEKNTILLISFLIPYLIVGYDVLFQALNNIIHVRFFDEKFLMSVATIGAFIIEEYPEAVAVMIFYQIGELFQDIAVGKSRKSIADLMNIKPEYAVIIKGNDEVKVSPEEVNTGDYVIIRAGEKIPLDGEIIEGNTVLNTASLTGESLPINRVVGDSVFSGSINLTGTIKIEVTKSYENSTVAKILELVENSTATKAKTERFITRFARYYTPAVVFSALFLAIIPSLITGNWYEWLNRALVFLVVSCPCALVISVPLSFFGGIGGSSKQGILIKGSNYLEALSKIKTVVFDKTGTLTKGKFAVSAIHPNEISEAELLDITALAESYSNHPVADSIIKKHGGHIEKSRIGTVNEISGMGIEAVIDNKKYYVGNAEIMKKAGADFHDCHLTGTIVHISQDDKYLGHIVINDEIKEDSAEAISQLKKLGIENIVMLSGDSEKVAQDVGHQLAIENIKAQLLPSDKVSELEKLLSKDKKLAFVGDGINDAPVLTRADVGISMGALGSDAAIEAADIVLMDDNPLKICTAINIARKTMKIIKQNIIFILAVKILILVLAAFGVVSMWLGIFGDVGVMIIAILNATRTMSFDKKYNTL